MPRDVDPGEHRMDTRHAADISAERSIEREDKRGRREQPAVRGLDSVGGIAPQRIIVPDSMRPMAYTLATSHMAPRLERVFDRHADQLTQVSQTAIGDNRKALFRIGHCTLTST